MMKKLKLTPEGMVKDLSKSKFPSQMYFDAQNIRIVATDQQSTFSVTNEHGNTKLFSVPIPVIDLANKKITYSGMDNVLRELPYSTYGLIIPRSELEIDYTNPNQTARVSGAQVIIGKTYSRDNVILFTTDNAGFDCIWEVENISTNLTVVVKLKYMRNLGFSTNNPIQAIYNYENSSIEKVYWVDGKSQLRFINLKQSIANKDIEELIDMSASVVDTVGKFITSQPRLMSISVGGTHTAGMIQYAFNLYRINGSQTTISPLSEMVSLGKDNQGGELNEVVAAMPTMSIANIDKNYTHIKIYAIKYTSYNQAPSISLISDSLITNYDETIFSDGGTIIKPVSSAELLFLGSNVSIPKHIESKNLRLFLFNVKELKFDLDIDMRAYAHDSSRQAVVWSDVIADGVGGVTTNVPSNIINLNTTTYALDTKHDSINRNYEIYKYTKDGVTPGVEGKYITLFIDHSAPPVSIDAMPKNRYLKSREIYRFAIEFYNKKGQYSFPKWISDLKAPVGNLDGKPNILVAILNPEFYNWLDSLPDNDDKPVGYRILRSDRTEDDKTIICQGLINSMIANLKKGGKEANKANLATLSNNSNSLKMPSLQRPLIQGQVPFIGANDYHELSANSYLLNTSLGYGRGREGFCAKPPGQWRAQNIQFNRMMQVFSPEVTFGNPVFNNSTVLNIVGIQKESRKNGWGSEYNVVTKIHETEAKFINGFTSASIAVTVQAIAGNHYGIADQSIFGPTNSDLGTGVFQFFREFKNGFVPTPLFGVKSTEIYGTPEITEIGQEPKAYNGNSLFRYSNSLRGMLIDNWDEDNSNKNGKCQVLGTNSYGARCVTIMEGNDLSSTPIAQRSSLEKIFTDGKFHEYTGGTGQLGPVYLLGNGENSAMVVELAHGRNHVYLGGIYGGNSMEDKSRSSYLGIGPYSPINSYITRINSPGDTYVDDFKFAKMTKTNTELTSQDYLQVTEIISIPLETTIDLRKRKDISINDWDNRYQPKEVEFHNYNKVYSQQSNFSQSTGTGYKFKVINEFDTKVIASSVKIAGEFIDNWTNFLENETRTLDGRYGPINATAKLGDEIYTLQDTAIAKLSIEPRVQTTATDGLAIQIGTGSVLNHHTYLSTDSGTKNKWSVAATSSGIYYYDTINRSIGKVGQGVENLTESEGFHSFMTNNTKLEDLVKDNPLIGKGVSIGYNSIDNEVYMTFLQSAPSYTIAYNESKKSFTSFYGYKPAIYIIKGQRMITTHPDNTSGWQHFTGLRNTFYGVKHESSITFLTAPGVDRDVVFNNAEYKMEMTNANGVDLPNSTFSSIRLWNEYQDTGEVPLVLRSNIRRKFRSWNVEFPRATNGATKTRDRIRNPWTYLKLTLDNPAGNKMVAHDITVSYTEY
jgi:hypothetical protein